MTTPKTKNAGPTGLSKEKAIQFLDAKRDFFSTNATAEQLRELADEYAGIGEDATAEELRQQAEAMVNNGA